LGRGRCGPRAIDEPVGKLLNFGCVHESICGASF
jgi:hypothetical protein